MTRTMLLLPIVATLGMTTALGQHVPSAVVEGDRVTVDADIAWLGSGSVADLPTGTEVELVQGTPLFGPAQAASTDGASPIVWRLSPGNYEVTAAGFPVDRLNPGRETIKLTVTVEPPGRQDQIDAAYAELFRARDAFLAASATLVELAPTAEEIGAALANLTGG